MSFHLMNYNGNMLMDVNNCYLFLSVYYRNHDSISSHLISFPDCLLYISCAVIGIWGRRLFTSDTHLATRRQVLWQIRWILIWETGSDRWIHQVAQTNTSARVLTAAIFGLISGDSGLYTVGVDVKLLPDLDTQIQLTVRRGERSLILIRSFFFLFFPHTSQLTNML